MTGTPGRRVARPVRPGGPDPRHPSRHRATLRPRYGRLAAAGAAVLITAVALVGGGALLLDNGPAGATASADTGLVVRQHESAPTGASRSAVSAPSASVGPTAATVTPAPAATATTPAVAARPAIPAASGHGRRIVFSQSRQRVWLVGTKGAVQRTYLVSGSLLDNLRPGSYQVYSRSRWAVGINDSGVMQYFVRFTHGPTGAAIGFHSIPTSHGTPLQSRAELGTPRSHGCIRQAKHDAIALWRFAPLGTHVDVVAS